MFLSKIPSSSSQFKYEVFLSFRGEDTRYNFTSHLHRALRDKGIRTFIDDELNRGEEISPSLLKAIEESQISVIIFSKYYANSRWCLEELATILECKKRYGQILVPVFYNVNPSDVRNQTGTYGDAFTVHEERFNKNLEKVQIWKDALKEAANLSGWHSSINKPESELIENIVKYILERLTDVSSSDDKNLVGIDSKIEHIVSLLGTEEVCRVGIWGTGGIGKTTLAEAVFNKIHRHFEGSYFALSVREESEQRGGLNSLRQKLHSALLRGKNVDIGTSIGGCRLGRRKLLIVFDDVTDDQQIEYLIGSLDCLGSQSRIIITTRDKQVLNSCGVNYIYEVKELIHKDAIELFCRYGFKQNHPTADYIKLSERVLLYAGGLPLALKVLGSSLFNKGKEVWESAISKLEKVPNNKIHGKLKISYDGLDDEVQKIFLDIACFFIGSEVGAIKVFLEACGYSVDIGISILTDNHLIIPSNNVIKMHELLQAMGREIVRQESTEDPGKRSRLWCHEDIDQVLRTNTGTGRIEGISLDMSKIEDIYLNHYAFANMHKLRFLKFYNLSYEGNRNKVHGFEALYSNFAALRYLSWFKCPFKSLPSSIHLKNLVTLEMHESTIEQLWNDVQLLHLGKLKELDLSFCSDLTSCTGFLGAPNLERLVLKNCTTLCEIPSSIQYLRKLNFLDLTYCRRLKSLPNLVGLTSLRKLVLSHCFNLAVLPKVPCNLEELRLAGTAIEELPSSIENLSRLVNLDLTNCTKLKSLPNSIFKWKSLENLCLSNCERLDKLPDDIGTLKSLRHLRVENSSVKEVPSSIIHLNNLYKLTFRRCKGLLLLPPLTGFNNLGKLDLTDCGLTEICDSVGSLSSLKILKLGKNKLESMPASIINLSKLHSLNISFTKKPLSIHHATVLGHRYCWFANCFKLDQNILKDIVKDALPEILPKMQDLATISKEYRDKEFEDVPTSATICYPTSEIPEWFDIQSSGSLIMLKLPRDWLNNFVGFALCVVAAVLNYSSEYNMSVSCQYSTSKDGQRHVVSEVVIDTPYIDCPYESKYVIIGFDSRLFPHQIGESLSCSDEVSFQIVLLESEEHSKFRIEVEKCGVRLMYAQRHEECSMIKLVESTHIQGRKMELKNTPPFMRSLGNSESYDYKEEIHKDIVKGGLPEILPKIQDLANISKEYRYKEFEDAPTTATICYPASEIPEWFSLQSSGSHITRKLPPDWLNNFVGFALCAVAEFPNDGSKYNMSVACRYLTSKDGQSHAVTGSEVVIDAPYIDRPCESKCVIIEFDSRLFPHQIGESLCCSDEVSFHVQLMESKEHPKIYRRVEKCGVRLMYAQRHEECSTVKLAESIDIKKWTKKLKNILPCMRSLGNSESYDYKEETHKGILPEILPKIQDLATISMEYRDKEFEDAPTTATICYPASEIPEWFSLQSSGSLITLKLPPDWLNNFVGFALCAVAEFPNDGSKYNMSVVCRYSTSEDGQSHAVTVSNVVIDMPYIDHPCESKFVTIGFDCRLLPYQIGESLCCSDEVSFRVRLTESRGHSKVGRRVEKCGVRLMYAQRHGECSTVKLVESIDIKEWTKILKRSWSIFESYDYMEEILKDDEDVSGSSLYVSGHQRKIIFGNECHGNVICEDR